MTHIVGEDTWFVRFYISDVNSDSLQRESALWNNLAGRLEGIASVGAFDVGLGIDIETLKEDDRYKNFLDYLGISIAELRFGSLLRYHLDFDFIYCVFYRIWCGNIYYFAESSIFNNNCWNFFSRYRL